MKFSRNLLYNKDIRHRIYQNSLKKTKLLLEEIFGLNFKADERILNIEDNEEECIYKIAFIYNGREITAVLSFENDHDDIMDILVEVVKINEFTEEKLLIDDKCSNFSAAVSTAMDLLEKKYNINFTPLDPEEHDSNILNIKTDSEKKVWEVEFLVEDQEAKFIASLQYEQSCIRVMQHKQHIIYLE